MTATFIRKYGQQQYIKYGPCFLLLLFVASFGGDFAIGTLEQSLAMEVTRAIGVKKAILWLKST